VSDNSTDGQRSEGNPESGSGALRSRRRFLAAGAAASVAALVGCVGDGSDQGTTDRGTTVGSATPNYPDEVVIGGVHPLTGSTAYVGQRLQNAVELAAKIKNENGGIQSMGGARVKVIQGDHQGDPTVGPEVGRELIEQGADILTGTYSSPVASSLSRVAESKQVPFVIDIGVAASILQERDLNYVYRVQPNSWASPADHIAGLKAVTDNAGIDIRTLGLYHVETNYGQAIRDGLRRAVGDTDLEIIEETSIGFGSTADKQVTSLRQADPDVVVPTAFTNQMVELVSAMQDQNYWPKILAACASGGTNPETYKKMGTVMNGETTSGYIMDPSNDQVDQINERYMSTYETASLTGNAAIAFTTAEVLIHAFEQAASTDPETVNQTIQNIEYADHIMAMPPISFTENGENANPLSVTSQVQSMSNKIVYPDRHAESEIMTDKIGDN
jgi:branched-chain amino acid transport system substrate-binding protein